MAAFSYLYIVRLMGKKEIKSYKNKDKMNIREIETWTGTGYEINQMCKGKPHKFIVSSDNLKWDTVYTYRAITKCKAGFLVITAGNASLSRIVTGWKKGAIHTIEISRPDGSWSRVLIMKGGKFHRIDKEIIENLTVGDIHTSFPLMADHLHWNVIGSKTWADSAYGDLN
tara:strand:+ start:158 stop:667 length:510 start_codon:yes stop_codon:yes gene_type:complete